MENVKSVVHISYINTLTSIYYAYFHSIVKYWIIFGGVSNIGNIFASQNNIMRIMASEQPRTSGRSLLKQRFYLVHASLYFH